MIIFIIVRLINGTIRSVVSADSLFFIKWLLLNVAMRSFPVLSGHMFINAFIGLSEWQQLRTGARKTCSASTAPPGDSQCSLKGTGNERTQADGKTSPTLRSV